MMVHACNLSAQEVGTEGSRIRAALGTCFSYSLSQQPDQTTNPRTGKVAQQVKRLVSSEDLHLISRST